jgi:hypothetical protein
VDYALRVTSQASYSPEYITPNTEETIYKFLSDSNERDAQNFDICPYIDTVFLHNNNNNN